MHYNKHPKFKSITKGLIAPNIILPAVYILFSAKFCSGSSTNNAKEQNASQSSLESNQEKQEEISAAEAQLNGSEKLNTHRPAQSLSLNQPQATGRVVTPSPILNNAQSGMPLAVKQVQVKVIEQAQDKPSQNSIINDVEPAAKPKAPAKPPRKFPPLKADAQPDQCKPPVRPPRRPRSLKVDDTERAKFSKEPVKPLGKFINPYNKAGSPGN